MIIKLSLLDKKNQYYVYGGSKEEIKKIKNDLNNKNIFLFPYIAYKNIKIKLDQIDICILPYTSKITVSGNVGDISKYTSPLKIFDYMKLGKLIVSANLPVLCEILKDKHNSILVKKYNDEKEWYKIILSIGKDIKKYDRVRNNAYDYANKFDLNWRVKKLLSI